MEHLPTIYGAAVLLPLASFFAILMFARQLDRFAAWIDDVERATGRPRPRLSLDDATARLAERFPRFSPEVARHMAEHGTRPDGDARVWKFDPLHQTRSPQPYSVAQARAFWRRIRCPTLYVEGGLSELRLDPVPTDDRHGTALALLENCRKQIR